MRAYFIALAVGTSLALSACASTGGLHPDNAPINPASLSAGRSLAGAQVSPAAWPKADWWTALGDAQLDALIAEALKSNPSLEQANARARLAQAQAGLADAARQPQADVGASVAEARIPATLPIGNGHNGAAKYVDAHFKWNLDLWGGQRAAWEAELGRQRAAEVDAQAARIELSDNVARAYVQLGYAFAQQDIATAQLQRSAKVRALTRQRVGAGIDDTLQLRQSDSEVASAEGKKAQADRAIDAARSALSVLLGQGPDRGLDIARPQRLPQDALSIPPNLPVDLLGHRADLVAARWRVEASARDIAAAKTQFLPNVSISAMAGLVALGGGNLFQAKSRLYDVAPAISLPIFDGGRRRAHLNGTDAQYDLAVAQYNQTLVRAVNEVSDDRDALDSLERQIKAQQRALEAADDAWALAEQRYKAGIGSYLEALSVRQELLVAEQHMAFLRSQQADVSLQMIHALGGGYRPSRPAPDVSAAASAATSSSLIHRS